MVRFLILAVCLGMLGGLTGCGSRVTPISFPTQVEVTRTLPIVTRTQTQEKKSSPTFQQTSLPSRTPTPPTTHLPVETQEIQLTPTRICNLAAAGRPIDVTVPDDTIVSPGESFVKTWRLVNTGSCVWTRIYAAVWFSGINMASRREEPLRAEVSPDQSVDISVDMSAPETAGVYQSNWKLRDENGNFFGIGPAGNSPFWVRIEVVALDTTTPNAPSKTESPVSVISRSGDSILMNGDRFDLDNGIFGPGPGDDILLKTSEGQIEWSPQNGARVMVFGLNSPSLSECRAYDIPAQPVLIGSELEGQYLCVVTDQHFSGSIHLTKIDLAKGTIDIYYLIWAGP